MKFQTLLGTQLKESPIYEIEVNRLYSFSMNDNLNLRQYLSTLGLLPSQTIINRIIRHIKGDNQTLYRKFDKQSLRFLKVLLTEMNLKNLGCNDGRRLPNEDCNFYDVFSLKDVKNNYYNQIDGIPGSRRLLQELDNPDNSMICIVNYGVNYIWEDKDELEQDDYEITEEDYDRVDERDYRDAEMDLHQRVQNNMDALFGDIFNRKR